MRKVKYITLLFIVFALLLILPNVSNAAVDVTRNIYANNGSSKFNFTGLTLDKSHEYEFGLTKTSATEVTKWHLITEYTETTATIDITGGTTEFTDVITAVDTGYITIRDKTDENKEIVLDHYPIDLSLSYLNITNYNVISNGKDLDKNNIQVNFWNASNSKAYYQYEKITDQKVITKFKEIKANNGDYNELQSLLKTTAPSSNWNTWGYWNGHGGTSTSGFGYTQRSVNVPDEGLYYMWIYLAGNNIKNLYGYILVDNLQPEIALDSISLPKTKEVKLGETLTLTPTFSPTTTTNKIVTWSSSDETVATVDNAGKITPKKIGSTIITVTSQDGNKKANCTVTVIASSSDNSNSGNKDNENTNNGTTNNGTTNNGSTNNGTTNNGTTNNGTTNNGTTNNGTTNNGTTDKTNDKTTATGKLPQTGATMGMSLAIVVVLAGGIFAYFKYNKLRGI